MHCRSLNPCFCVATTLASTLALALATGAEFTTGTHTIDSMIDGILATGSNTVVVVEESASVGAIPDFPGFPTLTSLSAEDGATIVIHGGAFANRIAATSSATIDIDGGVFHDHVHSDSLINIRGGVFNRQVLAGGFGELNIYGGNFGTDASVGYDSSDGAQVNIFGRSFAFEEDIHAILTNDFPFDMPGETISLTDATNSPFHDAVVTGKYINGSPFDIQIFLDGPSSGNVNLTVVPEPTAMPLVAHVGIILLMWRRSHFLGKC